MTAKGKHIKAPKVPCPICGKQMTKPGLVGHMAWLHGKQSTAPLLPSKAMPRAEEKRKAKAFDLFPLHTRQSLLCDRLENMALKAKVENVQLSDVSIKPDIDTFAQAEGISQEMAIERVRGELALRRLVATITVDEVVAGLGKVARK